MTYVTRAYPLDDWARDEIARLDRLCFSEADAKIKTDDGFWWLTKYDDQCVAYAGFRPSHTMKGWAYFCRAGVHPKHRGHGLQYKLICHRLARAKRLGFKGAITDTSTDNVISSNNLIQSGFLLFQPKAPWAYERWNYWMLQF